MRITRLLNHKLPAYKKPHSERVNPMQVQFNLGNAHMQWWGITLTGESVVGGLMLLPILLMGLFFLALR